MITLEDARAQLEHAVNTGSYGQAQRNLGEYTEALHQALAAIPQGDDRAAETLKAALRVLKWASRAVRAGRTHAAAQMERLKKSESYRAAPSRPPATFQIEG